MKHLVRLTVVAITLFGATLSASAGVTGGDPRPAVVKAQGVTGGDPRPASVSQPVSVWSVILALVGISA